MIAQGHNLLTVFGENYIKYECEVDIFVKELCKCYNILKDKRIKIFEINLTNTRELKNHAIVEKFVHILLDIEHLRNDLFIRFIFTNKYEWQKQLDKKDLKKIFVRNKLKIIEV